MKSQFANSRRLIVLGTTLGMLTLAVPAHAGFQAWWSGKWTHVDSLISVGDANKSVDDFIDEYYDAVAAVDTDAYLDVIYNELKIGGTNLDAVRGDINTNLKLIRKELKHALEVETIRKSVEKQLGRTLERMQKQSGKAVISVETAKSLLAQEVGEYTYSGDIAAKVDNACDESLKAMQKVAVNLLEARKNLAKTYKHNSSEMTQLNASIGNVAVAQASLAMLRAKFKAEYNKTAQPIEAAYADAVIASEKAKMVSERDIQTIEQVKALLLQRIEQRSAEMKN